MRGNPAHPIGRPVWARTIPACAGEPAAGNGWDCLCPDYPRVCGGTTATGESKYPMHGLSPRVRGNLPAQRLGIRRKRTIPACAGEPHSRPAIMSTLRDYPRVCGGTWGGQVCRRAIAGLSPRVRGNLHLPLRVAHLGRTIPACAGEPRPPAARARPVRDYPRVCGGTFQVTVPLHDAQGLSPRVRGNHGILPPVKADNRTIPACAGEPHYCPDSCVPAEDYPRVCGGTLRCQVECVVTGGLSQRVRGNREKLLDGFASCRTIPACAGEPFRAGAPG